MTFIVTFLGKGGSGRTTMAIAAAKKYARLGSRVLLVSQDPSPTLSLLLETPVGFSPVEIEPNLMGVQLSSTQLLQRGWEQVKELEAQYLRSPTLKNVYGQELGILPGMDSALALNALREQSKSGQYDVIVFDGTGDMNLLRMIGIPDVLSWYLRRFGQVFTDSDIGRLLSPFVQPVTSAILNVSWTADDLKKSANLDNNILEEGKKVLADPARFCAYLVTTPDPLAKETAHYLWGGAQQAGLIVKGVLLNKGQLSDEMTQTFNPLTVTPIPSQTGKNWQEIIDALPDLRESLSVPHPIEIDLAAAQVKVFLPGFDKKQVKLTQYGQEITIDAGDQRRNIDLPPALRGKPVKGAKFQNNYLIVSF